MDVIRLGPPFTYTFLPDDVIEGYDSFIWHERYQAPGEFQLQTYRIDETLNLLPEMTLISHQETREVMYVDSRTIDFDDDGNQVLTIKGYSLDKFAENRHVEGPYNKKRKMAMTYAAAGAAQVLLWNAFDNTSGKDVTREGDFSLTTKDAIPNVAISDSVSTYGTSRRWWLKEGPLYPQLLDILVRGDLGLRCIRPHRDSMSRVSVATALSTRGTISRSLISGVNALQFNVYQGVDRSHEQDIRTIVGFSDLRGDIDNGEYLTSFGTYKTACEIMSGAGGADQYRNSTEQAYTGLQRRVMSFDAGEPDIPDKPTYPGKNASNAEQTKYDNDLADWKTKSDSIKAEFLADAEDDALRALKKARKVSLFSGDISPNANYTYGTDYNLGDFVTLYGAYGQTEKMIVSEYVRTEDAEGDSGYPGLSMP